MKKQEREFLRRVESLGAEVLERRRVGSHVHLLLRAPDGRTLRYLVAPGCTDYRASRNDIADVRRWLLRGRAVRGSK